MAAVLNADAIPRHQAVDKCRSSLYFLYKSLWRSGRSIVKPFVTEKRDVAVHPLSSEHWEGTTTIVDVQRVDDCILTE